MKKIDINPRAGKDLKRLIKRNYNINSLYNILYKICRNEKLDPKYNNHKLTGNWSGYMSFHIEPDWIAIYYTDNDYVYLTRTGTHADLYGK
jgi:mRNA interferase YafQ